MSALGRFMSILLSRSYDLEQRDNKNQESQYVKNNAEIGWISWVATDDPAIRCVEGGPHEPGLEWVVYPLANADEHDAEGKQQSMSIGDAFDIDGKAGNHPRCAKCDKEVVPVLNLYPGLSFTHMSNA